MPTITKICSIQECNRIATSRLMCHMHYKRYNRSKDFVKWIPGSNTNPLHKLSVYKIWLGIRNRTQNPNVNTYKYYGGRGIKICKGWLNSIDSFYESMGDRPDNTSIDRIDNKGHYSCGKCRECIINNWTFNCRWANMEKQTWNRNICKNNSSGFIGIAKINTRWYARIQVNQSNYSLNGFADPEQAAIEYDKAVIFFRGYDGVTNIIPNNK